jgi:hypothetical protein
MRNTISWCVLLLATLAGTVRAQGHLQFFGYEGGADNPADLTATNSYTNFAKTATRCQGRVDPPYACGNCASIAPVAGAVQAMSAQGVKTIVDLSVVFFCQTPLGPWALRSDYVSAWEEFLATNGTVLDADHVASFYISDEPTSNGISATELAQATTLVKRSFPTIPASIVEASVAIERLTIPAAMDWIGIDEYAIGDPATDRAYQGSLAVLRSKLAPGQKIIYVMDGFWSRPIHGASGWTQDQLSCVASRWYALAAADPDAVVLGVFLWPSTDHPATCTSDGSQLCGSADLPPAVRDLQAAAGSAITGKKPLYTLFTRQAPAAGRAARGPAELGTQFVSSRSGAIMALRYYRAAGEAGSHVGRLWDDATGNLLASAAFENESAAGWQTQLLPAPVPIAADRKYRVSYGVNVRAAMDGSGLAGAVANGPLTALAGCSSPSAGAFPSNPSAADYFADVVFQPDRLATHDCAPALQGNHDGSGCQAISGWAWDTNQLNPPTSVDIYAGSALLASQVPANQFRRRLLAAGIGNGHHAFAYAVPDALKDGKRHLIRVRFSGTQTDLAGTPQWINCPDRRGGSAP